MRITSLVKRCGLMRTAMVFSIVALCTCSVAEVTEALRSTECDEFDQYMSTNTAVLRNLSYADLYGLLQTAAFERSVQHVLSLIRWGPAHDDLPLDVPLRDNFSLSRYIFDSLISWPDNRRDEIAFSDLPTPWNHLVYSIITNRNMMNIVVADALYQTHLAVALGLERTAVPEGRTPLADIALAVNVLKTREPSQQIANYIQSRYESELGKRDQAAAEAVRIGLEDYDPATISKLESMSGTDMNAFAGKYHATLHPITELDELTFGPMVTRLIHTVDSCHVSGLFEQMGFSHQSSSNAGE